MRLSILIFIILTLFTAQTFCFAADIPGPSITAYSALLMDYTTGQILYQKNAFVKCPPASTTKILTAIIAIEKGDLAQNITATSDASRADGSSIYLQAGERHSLKELLYAILLNSGNDASIAVADSLAGSESKFAEWMTAKARQIGAVNSHFKNCNGLPLEGHYSTAFDLAIIARYALHNPIFADMVKTRKRRMDWPGHPYERILFNHNKLLWRYRYADGVKTGYTEEAGHCLVSSATRYGRRLIAVVLKSKDMYGDSTRLFDYGFNNFGVLTLAVPAPLRSLTNIVTTTAQSQIPILVKRSINPENRDRP